MFRNPYDVALQVQDASNLVGVANDLPKVVLMVQKEIAQRGGLADTHSVATHPAIQLYLAKMMEMAEIGIADSDAYGLAYAACRERRHQALAEVEV